MVMHTPHKEIEMTTTQTPFKNFRNALVAGAATFVALAGVQSASAVPVTPLPINFPPVAQFTMTNPVAVGDNAIFNGSASRDVDGSIAKYEWDLNNDGVFEFRSTVFSNANHRYATPGTVTIKLRVTDNQGKSTTTSKVLTVHSKPVALLSPDRAVPTAGELVTYRATGSYDPDAGSYIREYLWDLDGNGTFERSTGTGEFVSMAFPSAGQKKIALRVVDRDYAFTDQPMFVRVNRRPTAVVSATPNPAVINQAVALSGAASTDDRAIVKYEWDLNGDGVYETNTGSVPTSSTMFATLGQAKVGLQVTDDDGAVDQSVATITVNPAPVADTTAPHLTITPTRVRIFDGTATFEVTCPMDELSCDTTLTLKGRFGSLKGKYLGSVREMIPGGETLEITVPLTAKAKRYIRNYGVLKAVAIAKATDAAGNTGTTKTFVRITKR
jgi:PKD domain